MESLIWFLDTFFWPYFCYWFPVFLVFFGIGLWAKYKDEEKAKKEQAELVRQNAEMHETLKNIISKSHSSPE